MATLILGIVGDESGQARLEVDYDETTGDPLDPADDPTLIAGRVANSMARAVFFDFRRTNQQPWFTATVPAGETRSANAGGPVRKMSDLAFVMLRTT